MSQQQNMMQDYIRTSTYQRAMLDNSADFQDKVSDTLLFISLLQSVVDSCFTGYGLLSCYNGVREVAYHPCYDITSYLRQ